MLTIGQSIRKTREAKGFKRVKLAKLSGVPTQTISSWERDVASPTVIYLISIADVLGVTLDELVGRTPKMTRKEDDE